MSFARRLCSLILLTSGLLGCQRVQSGTLQDDSNKRIAATPFNGAKAGDQREVARIKLCWCPSGRFTMGSPPTEPERRPGEDQVEVTLTQGFWIAKFEATQGQWKRVMGKLPANPANFQLIGNSASPPKRNGNTPAAPARRPPPHLATRSAANRPTSTATFPTMAQSRGRR